MVDARFCSPHPTSFTLTQTRPLDFTITEDAGTAVMRAEATTWLFLPCRYVLLDAGSRRPVLTVERSPSRLRARHQCRWKVLRGNSTSPTDLLFVAVPQPSFFSLPEVHVHLAGGDPSERCPDFVVERRGYCGRESTISRVKTCMGRVLRTSHIGVALYYIWVYNYK